MKKLLCLLLILLLLGGCTQENTEAGINYSKYQGQDYINELKNFTVREKNVDNTVDNEEFNAVLDEFFDYYVTYSYVSMHNTVMDYKKYGLEKPEIELGELNYGNLHDMTDEIELLKKLKSFDYDSLSYRQQYDYETMEYSMYETLASYFYEDIFPLLSVSEDLFGNLITIFTEFGFYDKESVDDYIVLLGDVDRYINDALVYAEKQGANGIYATDYCIDYELEFINNFVSKIEDNELIASFDREIDKLDFLTAEEKTAYKAQNKEIVINEVIPAYQLAGETLPNYYGKISDEDAALYKYSKEYAELLYMLNGSNNENIDTVFTKLKDSADYDVAQFFTCLYDEKIYGEFARYNDGEYPDNMPAADFEEMLEFLRTNMSSIYPQLAEVDYAVSELDPTVVQSSVRAYYANGPIDDLNRNTIKVNPEVLSSGSLFPTYFVLAHEGFPGHLYQNIYFMNTDFHPVRSVISFIGYTEGYAVTAQKECMNLLNFKNADTAFAMYYNETYYFKIYSIIDMGINYYGWTNEDIENFMDEIGIFGDSNGYGATFREILTAMPGMYCSYGLGITYYDDLRTRTEEALGDKFDSVTYYDYILKNGPLPFCILEGEVQEYINSNK